MLEQAQHAFAPGPASLSPKPPADRDRFPAPELEGGVGWLNTAGPIRLKDLRVFHLVRASCHACRHKAVIPNAVLLESRPGYTRLMELERQLRCRKCGVRGKASLDVEFRPRD